MLKQCAAAALGLFFVSALTANPDVVVNATMATLMKDYAIPGATVQLYAQGQPYSYNFGVANRMQQTPVTNDTIFELGSLTKLFTSLLLAEDVEAGTVSLHDSAADYIPDLLGTAALKPITLGNLASYTASFPLNLPNHIHTRNELSRALKTWQPAVPIGSVWQYSNVDFGLLGDVLEVANHQSFNQMYRTQILSPLHMNPIGLTVPDAYVSQMATGYTANGKMTPKSSLGLFPTAYALKATGGDLLRFLNASLGLSGTPSSIATAMQLTETPIATVQNWQQGMGWRINAPLALTLSPLPASALPLKDQVFNPTARLEKTGATDGFRAYIVAIPGEETGVVILLNKTIPNDAIVSAGRKILNGIETRATT